MERVILAMRQQPGHPFSLQELADIAIMSSSYFDRVFRDIVGVPPRLFLSALRLEAAKRLLLTTRLSVLDVCYEVGYGSLGTFTTRFTDFVGVPPSRLRQVRKSGALSAVAARYRRSAPDHKPVLRKTEITGLIKAPNDFSGIIFAALFESPIPLNQPVACDLRTVPGEYRIGPVPDGQYYVMAVAFDKVDDPLSTLLATKPLRGRAGPVRVENGVISGPTDVTLREARLTDPPIVIALPVLLAQRQRATETDPIKLNLDHSPKGQLMSSRTVLEPSQATLDPLVLAPENYKLVMENDLVRVFDVRIQPGETLRLHANGPSVIYVFNDGKLQHTYPDGTKVVKTAVSGALVWDDAEAHETTNIGGTEIHSLKIELKADLNKHTAG
ncbi:MAG TPA: AraC family transcriptional regulator [Pyrinomonadaceae bacterium]|nr:AraC family transcriptional regulator [Pyrinomonadaceae bacterium]